MPPRPSLPDALSERSLSRPSLPTPSLPRPSAPLPTPSRPRALLARLRPSRESVDLALACGALGTGVGVVLAGAYAAADAVLPLALLSGVLSSVRESLTP
ncbi:hypothetical protein EFA46_001705 [Halarchaeum sp. CBA1220]|uniref:hypothetical protein n=1 Tax=Halarchaeum sp. CBA1220 TaxID=1853682 RepID=UPI000F3A946E|nr:hypothetical protein [Halarchaeum sp. CBA1220]QLC32974.1 hypothetical protein EFA46_001705 [Halarchaeum sp. CBA1220]